MDTPDRVPSILAELNRIDPSATTRNVPGTPVRNRPNLDHLNFPSPSPGSRSRGYVGSEDELDARVSLTSQLIHRRKGGAMTPQPEKVGLDPLFDPLYVD